MDTYLRDCQNAADLVSLIHLIDRGGWMEVHSSNGKASIPKDMQVLFGEAVKRIAHEELDRMGVNEMFFPK